MLVLNNQLKDHLDNWDDNNDSVVDNGQLLEEEIARNDQNSDEVHEGVPPAEEAEAISIAVAKPGESSSHSMAETTRFIRCLESSGCGFLLGILFCRNATDLLTGSSCFMLALLSLVGYIVIPRWREQQRRQQVQALKVRRLELITILGRMGAEPFEDSGSLAISKEMVAIASTCESLLQTIDDAIERLQCLMSMKLGLGLWSPSVNRVEQAIARNNTNSDRKRSTIGASKAVLAKALLRGVSLLSSISGETETNETLLYLEDSSPSVVTLSWLKSTRQQFVVTLSHYLLWSLSLPEPKQQLPPVPMQQIIDCRARLEELIVQLEEYYFRDNSQRRKGDQASNASPTMDQMAIHLHAAEVALWAYYQATASNSDDNEALRQRWIDGIKSLVGAVNDIQGTMIASKTTAQGPDGQKEISTQVLLPSPPNPSSFEHRGESVSTNGLSRLPIPCQPTDKTLVFSGKGSVKVKKQRSSVVLQSASSSSMPLGTAMTQAMLFQELQTRLSTLELVDEIDMNEDEEIVNEELEERNDESPSKINAMARTTPAVFGLSVDFLSELRASIGPTASPETAENFGD